MLKWIKDIRVKFTKNQQSLLILDSCSAHLTEPVEEAFKRHNTTVLIIPGGCASVIQPLDVSINQPVKGLLRTSWMKFMLEQAITGADKISPPTSRSI